MNQPIHPVPLAAIDRILQAAFAEDNPRGDLTADTIVPAGAQATAVVNARESGVLSGGTVFARAMTMLNENIKVTQLVADGERFAAGDELLTVQGPAASVLSAERVALNLLQRMSAIATAESVTMPAAERAPARRARVTRPRSPGWMASRRRLQRRRRPESGPSSRGAVRRAVQA